MRSQVAFCAFGVVAATLASGLLRADVIGRWQSTASWHRTLKKAVPGTVLIDENGIEFRAARSAERWQWSDIQTFDLSAHELTLVSYQNRPWHEPGERRVHFTLTQPVPPGIASELAVRVARPARNADPSAAAPAIAEIPAHRHASLGGSNGVLRLKSDGIDYVTKNGRDERSWRWDDIETIANPNPWELRVGGYREIAEFDLKQAMPRELFERVWDRLYEGRR